MEYVFDIEQFQSKAKNEFSFLISDYGFSLLSNTDDLNGCSIVYVKKSVNVRVLVEGINWGGAARVAFGYVRKDKFQNYDLLDLLSVTRDYYFDHNGAKNSPQEEQLKLYARLLKDIGGNVLSGDYSVSSQLDRIRKNRIESWKKENYS